MDGIFMTKMEENTEQSEIKEVPKNLEELKKHLKTKNIIFGRDRTFNLVKHGKISKVFLASNAPADMVADLEHYSKISEFHIAKLEIPNDELGIFCKKPFSISVIGLMK
jgi:large subunit ribosomal protein L30e